MQLTAAPLRHAHRIAKALTPSQRVFQHVESVADLHEDGLRLVRMKHEHIPLVIPVFKDFWKNEITAKSVGLEVRDEHLYPTLFDCARDPYSYLILKNDELEGHILQYALYRNKDDDKTAVPKTSMNLKKGDKWTFIDDLVHFYENKVFEFYPHVNKMMHMFGCYVPPKSQGKGWMKEAGIVANRENLKLHAQGFDAVMGITTRKACEISVGRAGLQAVWSPTTDDYAKLHGTPVVFAENGNPATMVFMDIKRNLDNPLFK